MYIKSYTPISKKELEEQMDVELPDNMDREKGYALVNVLEEEVFAEERIPNSINIPIGKMEGFENRFSKDKKIILYCASIDCDASEKAAEQLAEKGFSRIYDYTEGMSGWKRGGNPIEGITQSVNEIT